MEVVLKLVADGEVLIEGPVPYIIGYPAFVWAGETRAGAEPKAPEYRIILDDVEPAWQPLIRAAAPVFLILARKHVYGALHDSVPFADRSIEAILGTIYLCKEFFPRRRAAALLSLEQFTLERPLDYYVQRRFESIVQPASPVPLWEGLCARFVRAVHAMKAPPGSAEIRERIVQCLMDLIELFHQTAEEGDYLLNMLPNEKDADRIMVRQALHWFVGKFYAWHWFPILNASTIGMPVGEFLLRTARPGGDWLVRPNKAKAQNWARQLGQAAEAPAQAVARFHRATGDVLRGIRMLPGRWIGGSLLGRAVFGDVWAWPGDPHNSAQLLLLEDMPAEAEKLIKGIISAGAKLVRKTRGFMWELAVPATGASVTVMAFRPGMARPTLAELAQSTGPAAPYRLFYGRLGLVASLDCLLSLGSLDIQPLSVPGSPQMVPVVIEAYKKLGLGVRWHSEADRIVAEAVRSMGVQADGSTT